MLTISDSAQEKILGIIEGRRPDVKGLRVGYEGKNRYSMTLVDEIGVDDDDVVVPFTGFDVVMDRRSEQMMDGTSIDYLETPTESGFKIENPLDNLPATPRPEGPPSEGQDRDIWEQVRLVLEEDINPGVASHGGYISLIDVKDKNVFIEMGGGCQGCGMASVTLKQGVERALRQRIPDLGEIMDVTEHASGQNPYYASSSK